MARRISMKQAINEALDQEMARDPSVIVMGEDIVGGAGGDDGGREKVGDDGEQVGAGGDQRRCVVERNAADGADVCGQPGFCAKKQVDRSASGIGLGWTYRYLDEEELAKQKREKAAANKAKAGKK